jgi:NAD(P)-dependent dehydrogenase (short-subunit alcohol dehydrogenase family)
MREDFEGKCVLVTGAGGGIGRAAALAFAGQGASTILVDLLTDGLEQSRAMMGQDAGKSITITADVSDERAVRQAFSSAIERFGGIDFAVNAAGVTHTPALTADIEMSDWDRVFRVNVTGTWLCMREELRSMVRRGGGSIVNIASFAGLRTLASLSAYVASKHAVVGLTKNAAVEYASQGIRINAIAPGGIMTPMMQGSIEGLHGAEREAALKHIAGHHPMARIGEAEEIADAALFLCSRQASFVAGACLSVDGGWAAS